jgi:hypothetical protein
MDTSKTSYGRDQEIPWDFDSMMARRKIKNWKYSRFTVVNSFAVEEKLKRISTWNRVALLNYYRCRVF